MDKWGYSYLIELITLWEKGEIARYKQFHVVPQCFQKLLMRQNEYLWSKGLKGDIAGKSNIPFSPQYFLPFFRTFCDLHEISNCRLQSLLFWKSLKFVAWKRVNLD